MPARESCQEPFQGYPAVGAVHPVIASLELRRRLTKIAEITDDVFDYTAPREESDIPGAHLEIEGIEAQQTSQQSLDEDEPEVTYSQSYNPNRHYRLFDAQTLGLSVFDADVSAAVANRARSVWQKHDIGQVKKEIQNEAQRRCLQTEIPIVSDRVLLVGGDLPVVPHMPTKVKLAFGLSPRHYDASLEILLEEHEIAKNLTLRRIARRHKQGEEAIRGLVISFVPHIPFLAFKKGVESRDIEKVSRQVDGIMRDEPLIMRLGELTTERSRLVRKRSSH